MADSPNPFDQFDGPATAPASSPANSGNPFDQFAASPATVAPVGYETVKGFSDELPAHAHPMPDDLQKQVVHILANDPPDVAAENARKLLRPLGFYPDAASDPHYRDSFDQVVDYRKKHGIVSDSVITNLMSPEDAAKATGTDTGAGAAAVRGMGDAATAGIIKHVDAAVHTAADVLKGDAKGGIANDFNRWEDVNTSLEHGDENNHPEARLVGQLIGGLALPSGMEGEALNAGKSVLRSGGTMREARAAALAAARNRVAKEGAAYGAVHGAADADPGNRLSGAAFGGVTGGAAGHLLAAAGQGAKPVIAAVRRAIGSAADPAVDVVGDAASSAIPDAPPGKPDYVELARALNIRRTPATNSRTGVATVLQSGLGALPGGSPVAKGAGREIGDLATAARGVADSVGPVSNPKGAGDALAEGAAAYKASSKKTANAMYGERDRLIGGADAPVSTDSTAGALDDIASRFPTSPAIQQLREHPAIRAIGGALPGEATAEEVPTGLLDATGKPITRTVISGGEPLTLGEVTEALSHVRGVVRNLSAQTLNGKATAPVLSRVKQVEQALEDDVLAAARKADIAAGRVPGAEGSAVKAQRDADAFYADRAQALNGALKKPIASAEDDTKVSGESVYNQVSGDMHGESGNLSRLRETWFRLPEQARRVFAATKIDDLGRATPGQQNADRTAWSFQTFLTNVSKLSPQARKIVFGSQADDQLQQVAQYASRLRDLDRARNFSNTAQKYFAGAFLATVGGAILHGDFGAALEGAAALPATWGGAKLLLSTPAMRDWTAKALRAALDGNEAAARVLTKKLGTIASTQPTIASEVSGLQRALQQAANDNLVPKMAASPNAGGPHEQKRQKAVTP